MNLNQPSTNTAAEPQPTAPPRYTPGVFERVQLDPGRAIWRSSRLEALGVAHGFSTRVWDVKTDRDLTAVIDATQPPTTPPPDRVILSKQVHGHTVDTPGHRCAEADAHVTDQPGEAVAVRTADCVPVLLATGDGRTVAAVHAGWRGLVPEANIIGQAVRTLVELAGPSTERAGVVAAVGPCISAERYEVGEEVAARFRAEYPAAVRDDLGPRPHLDVRAVALAQLLAAGLAKDRVDVFAGCTFDDAEDFFSYRRDGRGVGHLAAWIAPTSQQTPKPPLTLS